MKYIVDENGKRSAVVVDLKVPRSRKAQRAMLEQLREDLEDVLDYERTRNESSQSYKTFRETLLKKPARVRRRG